MQWSHVSSRLATHTYQTLYSLAFDGHTHKYGESGVLFPELEMLAWRSCSSLRKCTKEGVPIWCFCITTIFLFLGFLAVGSSSGQAIVWLANLTEVTQIIDCICMCVIYLFFYRAWKAQGFDRNNLPHVG
jgi:amino acid transporter